MVDEVVVNPVGQLQQVPEVDDYIEKLIKDWLVEKNASQPSWWQAWKKEAYLYKATKYIVCAVDNLINIVESKIPKGADKKAVVLASIALLYDSVMNGVLPVWLKPFSGRVKYILIYVIISTLIDWTVAKYRDGAWASNAMRVVKNA
jgi:hypothetical protein